MNGQRDTGRRDVALSVAERRAACAASCAALPGETVRYRLIAACLGIFFQGFTEPGHFPEFQDPVHGGNFNVLGGESVKSARDRKREEFRNLR